jgi:hypothetical protein
MIKGGYILQPRIIQESDISIAPPHMREIWNYLLRNACSQDLKYNGYGLKRGQLFRTYEEIKEDTKWYVGWRKVTYNDNQIKKSMKFLRETLRITTMKEPGGVLITICNYDYYQDPKNYERTNERTNERTIEEPPYNKNNKNKKEKKEIYKERKKEKNIIPPSFEMVQNYCTERKNSVSPKKFMDFYESKGWFVGKNKMKDWQSAIRTWENNDYSIVNNIKPQIVIPEFSRGPLS